VRGGLSRLTILFVESAHVAGTVGFVGVTTAGELGGETSAERFGGFVLGSLAAEFSPRMVVDGTLVVCECPVIGLGCGGCGIVIAPLFDSVGCPLDG
jgi:hypothetical protein